MNSLYKEIEKVFPKIEKLFTQKALLEFLSTPPDELEKYNLGLGTMIRLKLLGAENMLYKKFIECGLTNKDEISMALIMEFYMFRKNEEEKSI